MPIFVFLGAFDRVTHGVDGYGKMGTAAGRHRTTHIIPEIFGMVQGLHWTRIRLGYYTWIEAGTCKRELETQTGSIHADWNCRLKWIQAEQN